MSTGNPYKWRNKLPADSDMFFGRQKEIRKLTDMLSSQPPQNISIIGERRIGKSSLAYRVYHKLNKSTDTLAVYIDCDGLQRSSSSDADFFQMLGSDFKEILDRKKDLKNKLSLNTETIFTCYREFRNFVDIASKNGIKLVIFLDEFEHLPDRPFADNSFFSNLRAVADKSSFSLAFVTISKSELRKLTHQSIQSSGFYNIFERMPIGLLNHTDIEALRTKGFNDSGFIPTKTELKKIDYYAGDFVFFNQVACGFLWDAKLYKETPDWDDLEVKLLPDYETLWSDRTNEEMQSLKTISSSPNSSIDNFQVKAMEVRGLVVKGKKSYMPLSDFFAFLINEHFKIEIEKTGESKPLKTVSQLPAEGISMLRPGGFKDSSRDIRL